MKAKKLLELIAALEDDSEKKPKKKDDSFLLDHYKGKNVFIRTVTMIYTGNLVMLDDKEILLSDAAWIADTGRFADALATGKLNEVEPYPGNILVGRGAVLDISIWEHDLPRQQI